MRGQRRTTGGGGAGVTSGRMNRQKPEERSGRRWVVNTMRAKPWVMEGARVFGWLP